MRQALALATRRRLDQVPDQRKHKPDENVRESDQAKVNPSLGRSFYRFSLPSLQFIPQFADRAFPLSRHVINPELEAVNSGSLLFER
jgi:hypothetical protein